jgi:hypothetical protein
MLRAREASRTYLICINTDATRTTEEGGCWWEVAVPEVSTQPGVQAARARYENDRLDKEMNTWNVKIGINPISWMNDDCRRWAARRPWKRP